MLKESDFDVTYINIPNREILAEFNIAGLRNRSLALVRETTAQNALGKLARLAFDIAKELIKTTGGKMAVIVDDVFQVIGVNESALYVKALLNLIEYPPAEYERIVTIAATSEGVSRHEIGRHTWAEIMPMWNMGREGFKQLYEQVPGDKPSFDEVWRLTGGNPRMLEGLYRAGWNSDRMIERFIRGRGIDISDRIPYLWIDQPPPGKDPELGIGRYVAWQTPLHREAVKKALQEIT